MLRPINMRVPGYLTDKNFASFHGDECTDFWNGVNKVVPDFIMSLYTWANLEEKKYVSVSR